MRRLLAATVLFGAAFAGAAPADDAEDALKEMQGTYVLKALKKGGKSAPDEVLADFKEMVLKGNTITIRLQEKEEVATIKIDPSKTPAHLDLTPSEGPRKGKTMQGIYKYEKGTLTIVLSNDDRPKDFKQTEGRIRTMVFQKKKDR